MDVDIYVRTRGLEKDYRFLGDAPAEFWWRAYRDWTDTEAPTVLLESDPVSWRAYVAGIASSRRDRSDRPIQFNLVLTGRHDASDESARQFALAVLARSVFDLASERGVTIGGAALDAVLPEAEVERMLASPGEGTWQKAAQAVRTAYAVPAGTELTETEAVAAPAGTWIAGVANPKAGTLFLAHVAGLLAGQTGKALVLNLLGNAGDGAELAGSGQVTLAGAVAVLASRPESALDEEATELIPLIPLAGTQVELRDGVTDVAAKKGRPPRTLQACPETGPPVRRHQRQSQRTTMVVRTALPAGLILLAALAFLVFRIVS